MSYLSDLWLSADGKGRRVNISRGFSHSLLLDFRRNSLHICSLQGNWEMLFVKCVTCPTGGQYCILKVFILFLIFLRLIGFNNAQRAHLEKISPLCRICKGWGISNMMLSYLSTPALHWMELLMQKKCQNSWPALTKSNYRGKMQPYQNVLGN